MEELLIDERGKFFYKEVDLSIETKTLSKPSEVSVGKQLLCKWINDLTGSIKVSAMFTGFLTLYLYLQILLEEVHWPECTGLCMNCVRIHMKSSMKTGDITVPA